MTEKTELILQTPHDVLLQMANRARSLRLEQNMPQAELRAESVSQSVR